MKASMIKVLASVLEREFVSSAVNAALMNIFFLKKSPNWKNGAEAEGVRIKVIM